MIVILSGLEPETPEP